MEMNNLTDVFVYAVHVNLLGENTSTTKIDADQLLHTSKLD